MTKLTIVDIARLAGVSTATVSRSMHSPHLVSATTLKRVTKVIKQSNYIYNATAGDFSRRKSSVIGLLVLSNSTKVSLSIKAAQDVASEINCPIIIGMNYFNPDVERKFLRQFLERGVAGLLVLGHLQENLAKIDEIIASGIPCVFAWDFLPNTNYSYVGIDNEKSCFTTTEYLIETGHKRIAFISAIHAGVERISKRYSGYKVALEKHGLTLDQELVCPATASFANGKQAMQRLLALKNPPDCVFCTSDALAMGALSAAHEKKLCIPEDISIIGFEDNEYAAYTKPKLTTVHVPGEEIGKLGMKALIELMSQPNHAPIQILLPTSLVIRESVRNSSTIKQ